MLTIKVESINVNQIFDDAFTVLTAKVSNVEISRAGNMGLIQKADRFVVKTKGTFQGYISAEIEHALLEEIVTGINKGRKLKEAEKILFAMEYLNIICGRALSEINNQTGNRSRLTIPHYVTEKSPKEQMDGESETLFYQSAYGLLKITVVLIMEVKINAEY